jgi:hypothetical protein
MSYELFITRAIRSPEARHWTEDNHGPISFAEWEHLVEDDAELAIDYSERLSWDALCRIIEDNPKFAGCRTEAGFSFTREQVRRLKELARESLEGRHGAHGDLSGDTADWIAHPEGEERCFWYDGANISTKSPDVATLGKLLELAARLDACVRGEDGEHYRHTVGGFECYTPERGWLPLEEHHRGRPDWAPAIIEEIRRNR